jgi:hypothetical protein
MGSGKSFCLNTNVTLNLFQGPCLTFLTGLTVRHGC